MKTPRTRPVPSRRATLRRGAAMVEMALVLPIFVTVMLGIVEFGRGFMVANLVTNAAREGARQAIMYGSTNQQVTDKVRDFVTATVNVQNEDVAVVITITPAEGNSTVGNEVSGAQSQDLITVRVEVPFDKVSYIPGTFLDGKTLAGVVAMRRE